MNRGATAILQSAIPMAWGLILWNIISPNNMKLSTEIYTPFVEQCKQFYCRFFGFRVKFELEGFVVLQHQQKPEYKLLFCVPDSPFVHELFHPRFEGNGVLLQMEVANVEKEFSRLKSLNLP